MIGEDVKKPGGFGKLFQVKSALGHHKLGLVQNLFAVQLEQPAGFQPGQIVHSFFIVRLGHRHPHAEHVDILKAALAIELMLGEFAITFGQPPADRDGGRIVGILVQRFLVAQGRQAKITPLIVHIGQKEQRFFVGFGIGLVSH